MPGVDIDGSRGGGTRVQERGTLHFPVTRWGRPGGRPIIIQPGFPQTPPVFVPLAMELVGAGFEVIIPWPIADRRRRGAPGSAGATLTGYVDEAVVDLDLLRIDQCDLLGVGTGGARAWMMAARHPGRVRSLIIEGLPHPAAVEALRLGSAAGLAPEQLAQWLLENRRQRLRQLLLDKGLPKVHVSSYLASLAVRGVLVAALRWNRDEYLERLAQQPAVRAPTLWISGGAGCPQAVLRARHLFEGGFEEVHFPQGGCFTFECSPDQLFDPLLRHLRRV